MIGAIAVELFFLAAQLAIIVLSARYIWRNRARFREFLGSFKDFWPSLARWQRLALIAYGLIFALNLLFDIVDGVILGLVWVPVSMIVLIIPPYLKMMRAGRGNDN
jgi:hypothetical protein